MEFVPRGNGALSANPHTGVDEALSLHGSDWLWAVTAVQLVFFFVCLVPSFTAPESKRVFNYTLSMAIIVGAATYFTQASDLGWTTVTLSSGETRQVSYARYMNWAVSFPATLLALGLLSGISWTTIVLNISLSWFMVVNFFAAALVESSYRWGFFAFGVFSWVLLAMSTLNESREEAERRGISGDYMMLAGWVNIFWIVIVVAGVGVADVGRVVGVTGGFIICGVADVLLLPGLGIGFLVLSARWDFARLQLDFSEYRGVRDYRGVEEGEGERAAK